MDKSYTDQSDARILLVDDTPENLKVLRRTLEAEGHSILVATSGGAALKLAHDTQPDLILLDVMMPGLDGFETCRQLKADPVTQGIPVIFVTGRAETESIVEGFHAGGVDYVIKPFQDEEVLARVETHLQIDRLTRELAKKNANLTWANRRLTEEITRRKALSVERNRLSDRLSHLSSREAERWGIPGFVGKSPMLRKTLEAVSLLQNAEPAVLITGENGTGKELVARAIHYGSPRSSGPFIPVNCSAIPADLAESILFGHVRGAFTGADSDRTGYFELADGGTLFLDEVGDIPAPIQAKLLRVLEDGGILPVGGALEKHVDVRVLSATNADLEAAVGTGAFRQDLYFRLAGFPVEVPPLRERREDISLLSRHFLSIFAAEMGLEPPPLSPEALSPLETYSFPGNIRELKNILERALIESGGTEIRPEHLHFFKPARAAPRTAPDPEAAVDDLPLNLKQAEDFLIKRALDRTHGNIAAAARLLGTNRTRIYNFLK